MNKSSLNYGKTKICFKYEDLNICCGVLFDACGRYTGELQFIHSGPYVPIYQINYFYLSEEGRECNVQPRNPKSSLVRLEEISVKEEPVEERHIIKEEPVRLEEILIKEETVEEQPVIKEESVKLEEISIKEEPVEEQPVINKDLVKQEISIVEEPVEEQPVIKEKPVTQQPSPGSCVL